MTRGGMHERFAGWSGLDEELRVTLCEGAPTHQE